MNKQGCYEEAAKGKPFEMDGKVIYPVASIDWLKKHGKMARCIIFYPVRQDAACKGCKIGEICYLTNGPLKSLTSDLQHFFREGRSQNAVISQDVEIV